MSWTNDPKLTRLAAMRSTSQLLHAAIEDVVGDDPEVIDNDLLDANSFLRAAARYVEACGGRLEMRAVFPEQTITLQVAD